MHCQLYLNVEPTQIAQPDFSIPSLQHMLAKSSTIRGTQVFEASLCSGFGVQKQRDWPAAALSWLGEGNDPKHDDWFYADPVHFALQRDYFSLALPAPMSLSNVESQALLDSMNRHFYEEGLHFYIGSSGRWYMRTEERAAITTSWLAQIAGRDVRPFMPQGTDAERWNSLLNEIQMLLHGQAVNHAREEQGQPAINSLWFSGGGTLSEKLTAPYSAIFTDNPFVKGLAVQSGIEASALPDDFAALRASLENVNEVAAVELDDLAQAEQKWFAPMLAAIRGRKITQLSIDLFMQDQHLHAMLKPLDLWKVWRKPQPLRTYFSW